MERELSIIYSKVYSRNLFLFYMIPQFPKFKKLELSDKKDVEKFTSKFLPYSDFNFVSMWSWDIKGDMRLSVLNENLVVRFTDYLTAEPFYSFFGDNKANETVEKLLDLSKKEGLEIKLRLVPEDCIADIDRKKFNVVEDRAQFDYVYEVKNLIKMDGGKFEVKRKHARFFKKNFKHEIRILDLKDSLIKEQIVNLFRDWANDKVKMPKDYFENEFHALSRFLDSPELADFFSLGIYFENKLIAASITLHTHGIHNLGHFQKSRSTSFKGLNDYLVNELAKMLGEKNIKYMNCEQDLGLLGLRESKESYVPSRYLKKYLLSKVV